jgi:tetratricopeptide (TPR) repeat protein
MRVEATMKEQPPGNRHRVLFRVLALLTPLVLVGITELVVRALVPQKIYADPTLVGSANFLTEKVIDGKRHYQVSHNQLYAQRKTVFPVEKSPNTLRIFALGGSASAGWPHPPSQIYTALLATGLRHVLPERRLEIINLGAHAYASYRVRLVFDAIIDCDPDAIVIYSGNNEFLEKRSYVKTSAGAQRLVAAASRLATFRLLMDWLGANPNPTLEEPLSGERRQHVQYAKWSKVMRVALDLRKDPEQFEDVKRHHAASIDSMVRQSTQRGVPVVLVTVPANLRGWRPNVSLQRLENDALREWDERFTAGRRALLNGKDDAAVRAFRSALELEPLHADTYYYLARALERTGDFRGAVSAFREAKELDHNPFRALDAFNTALRSIVAEHELAVLADAERAFLAASAPRAPGFDLFLDYVHPTRQGNLLIAEVVFDALREARVLGEFAAEATFVHEEAPPYDDWQEISVQRTVFWLYGLMHQYESMVRLADLHLAHRRNPQVAATRRIVSDYLELDRKMVLGIPVAPDEEQRILGALEQFYRQFYPDLLTPADPFVPRS